MDQLIFASLSHTHYWYEVGMLKVPAVVLDVEGAESRNLHANTHQNVFIYLLQKPAYKTINANILQQ